MNRKHTRYTSEVQQYSLFGDPVPAGQPVQAALPRVRRSCGLGHVWVVAEQLSFDGQTSFQVVCCSVCGLVQQA